MLSEPTVFVDLETTGADPRSDRVTEVAVVLIETLRSQGGSSTRQTRKLFTPGERRLVTDGPFAGLEAIYQMIDGASRVMVLFELLSKSAQLNIAPASLRKIG